MDWGVLTSGILFLGLGILTIVEPFVTMGAFVLISAIAILIRGISQLMYFFKYRKRTKFGSNIALLTGIIEIVLAVLFLFNMNMGIAFLGTLFAIWFIFEGITNLMNLWYAALWGPGLYLLHILVSGIGVALGFVLLFMPLGSSAVLGTVMGFYLSFLGIMQIVNAFMSRKTRE